METTEPCNNAVVFTQMETHLATEENNVKSTSIRNNSPKKY